MDSTFVDTELEESFHNMSIEPTSCNCNSTCSRAKGRGQCPCRSLGQECNDRCTCGTKKKKCINKVNSESERSASDVESPLPSKKGRKGRKRRRRPSGELEESDDQERRLDLEIEREDDAIKTKVESLSRIELNELAIAMIKRTPGLLEDFIEQYVQPPPPPPPRSTPSQVPKWCKCGRCRQMDRDVEKKCCRQTGMQCHSMSPRFRRLCLDPQVLDIVRHNLEDQYARAGDRGNRSYRHASYRTYIHWQYGRLGRGNRRVVPSCCLWAIRTDFPSANGHYVGYQDAVGYRDD